MGYLIQYEPELNYKYKIATKPIKRKKILLGCGLLICAFVICCIPYIRSELAEFLIPGDEEVTVAAFNRFVADLRAGLDFSDAAVGFCREIWIHG